ncbi:MULTISPECIES: nuclear transport factor 2 family protein [unclassified Mycobacterium]|uniref:nuclear transport factor 2 family protein n=1 Tax=unclassified Mycobacterium TaxID=2642494 RepID=UPI000A44E749|nr:MULTISPECIES: nuclear transport factor 2 family protein [unclassified Mycobacterium]
MSTPIDVAQRFYDALAGADGRALFELLTEDFVGTVSPGMPHGVGGQHHGPADMIAGVWGAIGTLYDMHVDPAEYLVTDDGRVVVIGRYWARPATAKRRSMRRSHTSSRRGTTASRLCSRSPTRRAGASRDTDPWSDHLPARRPYR